MLWSLILICFSLTLFITYNAVSIYYFGIPWSLSKTYYLYEEKKKNLGWLFTGFMWLMALTMLPAWIEVSIAVGSWMCYFTFLTFISGACIAFVGTAARYHDDLEGDVHMTTAKICAVCAILWCFLVCWVIWYVTLIGAIIPSILGWVTESWKESRDYWFEMMAFIATFLTIIIKQLILLM